MRVQSVAHLPAKHTKKSICPGRRKPQTPASILTEQRQRRLESLFFFTQTSKSTQQPCLRLAWSRAPSWRRCWRRWRIWSQKPAGTSARPGSPYKVWTRPTSRWCSSPCGTTASTRTDATETSPWGSTSAGAEKQTYTAFSLKTLFRSSTLVLNVAGYILLSVFWLDNVKLAG